MFQKKKLRLKKFYLHPTTTYILLTIGIVILSACFSGIEMQATYNTINVNKNELEPTLIAVENLLSFDGMKFIISNATKNFISFAPLGTLLVSLLGLTIAESTGMLETITRRKLKKIPKNILTFIILFVATISSLINEVGYAILIPLVALIYFMNDRNPILGIVTAFTGVAFGYGVSIFVGSMEDSLIEYTKNAAALIDDSTHIALTSNLFFIVAASIIISIVGTIIIEKIIAPKIGKYKKEEELAQTEKYSIVLDEEKEQVEIEKDRREKAGMKSALITGIIFLVLFIWSMIPNLPYSGMLLDMNENTYLNQVFGTNSYFKNSFTYLVSLFFCITGIAYGFAAHTIKSDHNLIDKVSERFSKLGSIFLLMFVAAQFIAIFKKTNIGMIITAWLANLIRILDFSGVPLIIITIIFIAIANIFLTGTATKWMIFAPVVVPLFMQSNISPQFAQIVMRVGDSMTKGFTPILAAFTIYLGYLNIYNLNTKKPYTISKSLKLITPYFLLISATWILLIIGWYIIGLPIGPNVFPTI